MENCGNHLETGGSGGTWAALACSACEGEYEDPDRTAWTAGGGEQEGEPEPGDEDKAQES